MRKQSYFPILGLFFLSLLLVACNNDTMEVDPLEGDQIEQQVLDPAGNQVSTLYATSIRNANQVAERSTEWLLGDVFAGVAGGNYSIYDKTGAFKETVYDGLGGFTTGSAFNPDLSKFYATNFSNTKVVVYDNAEPHGILQVINTDATSPDGHSESVVFAANGDFYVGHPDGNRDIHRYNADGVLQQTYDVAVDRRGSDWLDLAADQQTMFYTSEGGRILRYDVLNDVQLPDFADIGGISYALRLLPPGDGTGGLIVANTGDIKRLDGSGAVVQTYDATGENCWFAMNLDPNGTSFWAGDFCTNNFYRFDIATGAIELGPVYTGPGTSLFGLSVKGELTSALVLQVPLDIKPTSCPNPLNLVGGGVFPVAILGTEDFDVSEIDPASLELAGVAPLRYNTEDVAAPVVDPQEDCECTTAGPDGYYDLTLKFKKDEIVAALGDVYDGDVIELKLTGMLLDGTEFEGKDCVVIISNL